MKKFLFVLRSVCLTIVGVVIAVVVTSVLHLFFSLFLDPMPKADLAAADWNGRSELMNQYMLDNPSAVYTMLVAHAFGAGFAVYWSTRTAQVPSWKTHKGDKPFTGAIVLVALWVWKDLQDDLVSVPVGIFWTVADVVTTLFISLLGFLLAGGFRKHEGPASVTSDEDVYRG
ncbi:MAG: hypothetical protein VXY91_07620 [Bacteroidota bacterium]|nr:hypothetical protein [Bacteroidota bacterium]